MFVGVEPVLAKDRVGELIENSRRMTVASPGCEDLMQSGSAESIVICAERPDGEKHRLPLPDERERDNRSNMGGEVPRASLDAGNIAPCGIFEGQRKCSRAEAKVFGYGNGRDPLTFARKLAGLIFDPDAEADDEPLIPSAF